MKKFNLIVAAAATLLSSALFAQNTKDKWLVGLGTFATDHTAVRSTFSGFFDTKDMSMGFPISKINVARSIAPNLAVDLQASMSSITNKRFNIDKETFILAGVGVRYMPLSEKRAESGKGIFDPYVRAGVNYHKYSYKGINISAENPVQTYNKGGEEDKLVAGEWKGSNNQVVVNGGVGLNVWITKRFGINVESQYNYAPSAKRDYADFFQHSAGVVVNFGAPAIIPPVVEVPTISDRDGDGIPDSEDRCPDVAGPAEFQGCPDTDGDGIPDIDDRCPEEKGPIENQGCPVTVEQISTAIKNVNFQFNSSKLTPESYTLIENGVKLLNDESFVSKKFYVDGHTDRVGTDAVNNRISKQRAEAVKKALIEKGVAADRILGARGFGKKQLKCTQAMVGSAEYATQKACDAENRRVVISNESGETITEITKEKVIKK